MTYFRDSGGDGERRHRRFHGDMVDGVHVTGKEWLDGGEAVVGAVAAGSASGASSAYSIVRVTAQSPLFHRQKVGGVRACTCAPDICT